MANLNCQCQTPRLVGWLPLQARRKPRPWDDVPRTTAKLLNHLQSVARNGSWVAYPSPSQEYRRRGYTQSLWSLTSVPRPAVDTQIEKSGREGKPRGCEVPSASLPCSPCSGLQDGECFPGRARARRRRVLRGPGLAGMGVFVQPLFLRMPLLQARTRKSARSNAVEKPLSTRLRSKIRIFSDWPARTDSDGGGQLLCIVKSSASHNVLQKSIHRYSPVPVAAGTMIVKTTTKNATLVG